MTATITMLTNARLGDHLKKLLLILLRWGVPVAIIAWLATDLVRNKSFAQMWSEPKQWDLLALATCSASWRRL